MVRSEQTEIGQIAEKVIEKHKDLKRQVKRDRKELKEAVQSLADTEQVQSILQKAAKHIQDQVHKQLSLIVTKCLKAVFPNPYTFEIRFETKRGKTEARMVFIKNGHEHSARSGIGGSVLEVAAFALQLGCLMIQEPAKRRFLQMDEPFKAVSSRQDNKERVSDLLVSLSKELDFQFLTATHDPVFQVGKVVEI